ncbi:MAG: polysaccharide pyruvyl transferase family protein [Deltaproteobacteria bacterium]|nr:polysaccharide pyruvyl transferase family protein [Deltaproteobacteria bacterium]
MFATAVQRHLSVPGVSFEADKYTINESAAERINEECDAFILPLANAFRSSFERHLIRYTKLIKKLKIPVIVVGVGAQAKVESSFDELKPINNTVIEFSKEVLERSSVIGVRGAFTAEYLNHLGIKNVEVIGCPSMYYWGKDFQPTLKVSKLDQNARLAVNITENIPEMASFALQNYQRYPDTFYFAQDINTLQTLWWGLGKYGNPTNIHHMAHPFYLMNRVRFFTDIYPWMNFISQRDFSYGSRIHGNIIALQAGIPSVLIAHDSRTLELAQYLGIPHLQLKELSQFSDVSELYELVDLKSTQKRYKKILKTYRSFLEKNHLAHTLSHDAEKSGAATFDSRISTCVYPEPVTSETNTDPESISERLALHRTNLSSALSGMKKKQAALESELSHLKAQLAELLEQKK